MPRAVRFDQYGGIDVLNVVDVERPAPGPGEVLVRVKAAGVNPGEASIREGRLHERFPATFPSGEGTDLAGIVEELGPGVEGFAIGDEVIGFTERRASHAELALVEADHLVPRPEHVPWEADGVEERIAEAAGDRIDAFIDTYGSGYVELALRLGVAPDRIDTIIDFDAAERHGVKTDGSAAASSAEVLAELAGLIENGELEVPIAGAFPLERVRDAYAELEQRHTRGKIVLTP